MTAKTARPRPALNKPKPERISHFTTVVQDDTMEFIHAVETFKKAKHRPFPTWGEILQVIKELGYRKVR